MRYAYSLVLVGAGVLCGCSAVGQSGEPDPGDESTGGSDGEAASTGGDSDAPTDPAVDCEPHTPASIVRMLNRREYRNTIRDLLQILESEANAAAAALPADAIVGFDNNAESLVASAAHVEQHLAIAETLAANVSLGALLECDPAAPGDEQACVDGFIADFGRRAFRRPLVDAERDAMVGLFDAARTDGRSFDEALRLLVQAFVQAPQFLYRVEASAGADDEGARVSGYELASRLSYFVWASMPDDTLLDAAEAGDLDARDGVEAHARRLLADPKARATTASFHRQWLELHALEVLAKSEELAPGFETLKPALAGEVEAFADHVFWESTGQVAQLFVSDTIMLNWDVADLYGIDGEFGGVFTEAAATQERFGLLTHAGLLAHTANPDRTSPTRRGRFVRQQLLCDEPPPPPEAIPQVPDGEGEAQTFRERLDQHARDPACRGCHVLLDPLGFALEHYDLVGAYRSRDNGEEIDASGEIFDADGIELGPLVGARELSQRLADSDVAKECVARQWFRFAMGRPALPDDSCSVDEIVAAMDAADGSMPELLVAIATSHVFAHISAEDSP